MSEQQSKDLENKLSEREVEALNFILCRAEKGVPVDIARKYMSVFKHVPAYYAEKLKEIEERKYGNNGF